MVERLIEYCGRNRLVVFMMVAFASVIGVWCMMNVPLDAIPDLSDTQVIIFAEWKGRSPNLVEDQVTYPIVTKMLSVPRVKSVRGYSFFGFSFIYVLFEDGTDLYWARSRVLEYLSGILGRLPTDARVELGPDATGVGWGFVYALVDDSGQHDLQQLRAFQDWYLRYWLVSIPGVSEVATVGGYEKQYQVILDPNRLLAYNIPVQKVIRAIRRANNDVGGRILEFGGREYFVRGLGYVQSVRDLEHVVVAHSNGTPVLLKDIARVQLGPEIRRGAAELNGLGETVGGIVVVRFGENVLKVIERVKRRLKELEEEGSFPPGVKVVIAYDRSDLIWRSIKTLQKTLIEESLIVAAVTFLFLLHLPTALVAIITLPIAVVLSFIPMYAINVTSNIMSLGGIAIAIGAMVDAAVVLIENAHKKLEHAQERGQNFDREKTVIDAAKEVGKPIFFSLLIITVSFLPVFTLEAQEGRLFRPLAYTKTFSMLFASLLSITLAPALMVILIRGHITPEHRHPISRFLHRIYNPLISSLLRWRWSAIPLAALAVLLTVPIYHRLGSEFMPPLNEGDMLYMPTTPPGLSITEAVRQLQIQDKIIASFPEVKVAFGKVGRADTATDPAPLTMVETHIFLKRDPEKNWRKVYVKRWYSDWAPEPLKKILRLIWPEWRPITWDELKAELDEACRLPAWTNAWTMPIKTRIDMLTTGIRTPIGIKILGPDLKVIEEIGKQLEAILSQVPGTLSVYADRAVGGYFVDIVPYREVAARYGLNVEDVFDIVQTAIGGMVIDQTIEGRERYTINVRYGSELRNDLEDLKRVLVPTPAGAQVPLGQLADIRITPGPPVVKSENGMLAGYVYVDVDTLKRDIGGYVRDAKEAVRRHLKLPPGYSLLWTGQYEFMLRVAQKMRVIVPVTLAIIVMLLFLNFRSLPQVLIILLSVPFAITGSIWLLYLLGYNLSVAVWVGIIALAGVAAETGIVMLVYLDEAVEMFKKMGRYRHQYDLAAAITYGAVQRVRPKLMTVMTTIMGLIPIMWSHGTGSEVMQRIAAPMIGGLVTSTALTLILVPAIYSYWRQREVKWVKPKRRPGEPVIYYCPFHPDVKDTQIKPCPHCGMILQEMVEEWEA